MKNVTVKLYTKIIFLITIIIIHNFSPLLKLIWITGKALGLKPASFWQILRRLQKISRPIEECQMLFEKSESATEPVKY